MVALNMNTLFYPHAPGFKVGGPSQQAAVAETGRAAILRVRVLETIRERGQLTADQCAMFMGENILSIRPRFSELLKQNKIADTGERGKNESGHSATIWREVKPTQQRLL